MNRVLLGLCAGAFALFMPGLVDGQQYKPGDKVVVIRNADIRVKAEKVDDAWPGLVLRVTAVNGDYLWVSNAHPGWLERRHVVPIGRGAIDRLTEMIRTEPESARLYSGRANVWGELGELDIAIADLNEAIRLDPSAAHYNNRAIVWVVKGEYDKAIADYDEALRLDPRHAMAYHNRGLAWTGKGEYEKAIADFNEALRLDPNFSVTYSIRGVAWQARGEYDKAIADYNEALRLDPKNVHLYNGLAWLRATCPDARYRDGEKAVADATRACELSGWKEGGALDTLAAAYAEKGDFDKAVEMQKKAMDLASASEKAEFASRLKLYESGQPFREDKK